MIAGSSIDFKPRGRNSILLNTGKSWAVATIRHSVRINNKLSFEVWHVPCVGGAKPSRLILVKISENQFGDRKAKVVSSKQTGVSWRSDLRVMVTRVEELVLAEKQPFKLLVTGDRNWTDKEFIKEKLRRFWPLETILIHGACEGADKLAEKAAMELGWVSIIPFPADWKKYGNMAGPHRNWEMVCQKPDLVMAFHDNLQASRGTRDCANKAIDESITVIWFEHGRTLKSEGGGPLKVIWIQGDDDDN